MDNVDGSDHYTKISEDPVPTLLTVILDTNPNAWALLSDSLSVGDAIANLLVFINAHLAFNQANQVAIIASHIQRAEFLYPSQIETPRLSTNGTSHDDQEDIEMADAGGAHSTNLQPASSDDANQYPPFRVIQETLLASLSHIIANTSPESLTTTPSASLAGALTLALAFINKQATIRSPVPSSDSLYQPRGAPVLLSRILIFSVSGDLAHQYIPIMNTIFACQRQSIPIDIAKVAGDTVFLQQASDATRGTYINIEHPQGILQYLMMGFLPDQTNRRKLISPTLVGVDFRAACFCHRDVVDVGFVCSICLSIFCCPPDGALCLTCGTQLSLENYGATPAVVARKKKKRKKRPEE